MKNISIIFILFLLIIGLPACGNNDVVPPSSLEPDGYGPAPIEIQTPEENVSDINISYQGVEGFIPPIYNDYPPGVLVDFEWRAISAPSDFLNHLDSMDEVEFWAQVGEPTMHSTEFSFDNYALHVVLRETVSDIVLTCDNKTFRILAVNQPIHAVYWMDRHALVIRVVTGIFLGDKTHKYYAFDLSSGKVEELDIIYPEYSRSENFPFPALSALLDFNIWYRGTHLFFGLSPQAGGPEQKHVFAGQTDGSYILIAEDVWDWALYGGLLYYRKVYYDDSNYNVYFVNLSATERGIAYTVEDRFGRIETQDIRNNPIEEPEPDVVTPSEMQILWEGDGIKYGTRTHGNTRAIYAIGPDGSEMTQIAHWASLNVEWGNNETQWCHPQCIFYFEVVGDYIIVSIGEIQGTARNFFGDILSVRRDGGGRQSLQLQSDNRSFFVIDGWIYHHWWSVQGGGSWLRIRPDGTDREDVDGTTFQGMIFFGDDGYIYGIRSNNLVRWRPYSTEITTLFLWESLPAFEHPDIGSFARYEDITITDEYLLFRAVVLVYDVRMGWSPRRVYSAQYRVDKDGGNLTLLSEQYHHTGLIAIDAMLPG